MTLDIGAKHGYPSSALSNFASHKFTFDGVECASMEGFLQSLKFNKPHIQVEVCKLSGVGAKHRGRDRNSAWKNAQCLWWKGVEFPRDSEEYQDLLDQAYLSLAKQNGEFRKALMSTGDQKLTHTIGRNNEMETILTQKEFCTRLEVIRHHLIHGHDLNTVTNL